MRNLDLFQDPIVSKEEHEQNQRLVEKVDVLLQQEAKICSTLSRINERLSQTILEVDAIAGWWAFQRFGE